MPRWRRPAIVAAFGTGHALAMGAAGELAQRWEGGGWPLIAWLVLGLAASIATGLAVQLLVLEERALCVRVHLQIVGRLIECGLLQGTAEDFERVFDDNDGGRS